MHSNPVELHRVALANIETSLALANTAFAAVERLASLNLVTTRNYFKSTADNVNTLLDADDLHELMSLRVAIAAPAVGIAAAYARSIYRIAVRTNEEVSSLMDAQFEKVTGNIFVQLDQASKTAPANVDAAVTARTAPRVARSAFDSMSKSAGQVVAVRRDKPVGASRTTPRIAAILKPKRAA